MLQHTYPVKDKASTLREGQTLLVFFICIQVLVLMSVIQTNIKKGSSLSITANTSSHSAPQTTLNEFVSA